MTVWVVPIEDVPNRYSADWNRWFPAAWPSARFIPGETPPTGGSVETGDFLDVFGTSFYKSSQVMRIAELLRTGEMRSGDILFFHDLWFPLSQVFYMLDLAGIHVRVAGFLHAGSYCRHDLLSRSGMGDWAADVERAWFRRVDRIYVFSSYHGDLLRDHRGVDAGKAWVVDFPYQPEELAKYMHLGRRSIQVAFPHRRGPDKGHDAVKVLRKHYGLSVQVFADPDDPENPVEHKPGKDGYFRMLADSDFVFAWPPSETFGIAVAEAKYLGAQVIAPNRFSYRSLYTYGFETFDSLDHAVAAIREGTITRVCGVGPLERGPRSFEFLWKSLGSL